MPSAWPRRRPTITVTIETELRDRLDALVARMPGSNRSALIGEVLEAGLPLYEQMADAMESTRRADGSLDESRARDQLAQWAGAQLLGLQDKNEDSSKGGGSR